MPGDPSRPYTSLAAVIGYVSLVAPSPEEASAACRRVSNRYDIMGNGLVRIVHVVVRAVHRAVQPTINRQRTARHENE